MRKKTLKLTDQLRRAIDAADKTRYRVGKETGIDHATISRFMAGKGGLSMEGLDLIAECLGLELVFKDRPTKKGK